jgi:hypothetical protein
MWERIIKEHRLQVLSSVQAKKGRSCQLISVVVTFRKMFNYPTEHNPVIILINFTRKKRARRPPVYTGKPYIEHHHNPRTDVIFIDITGSWESQNFGKRRMS